MKTSLERKLLPLAQALTTGTAVYGYFSGHENLASASMVCVPFLNAASLSMSDRITQAQFRIHEKYKQNLPEKFPSAKSLLAQMYYAGASGALIGYAVSKYF
jgi:hypothetical protein